MDPTCGVAFLVRLEMLEEGFPNAASSKPKVIVYRSKMLKIAHSGPPRALLCFSFHGQCAFRQDTFPSLVLFSSSFNVGQSRLIMYFTRKTNTATHDRSTVYRPDRFMSPSLCFTFRCKVLLKTERRKKK